MDNLPGDFMTILDFLPDAVILYDGERIRYVNRAACDFLAGESPESLVGASYLERIHPDDRFLVQNRISAVFHGKPSSMKDYRIISLRGDIMSVEAKATMVKYSGVICNLVILHDITERKKRRDELLALNEQLRRMKENQTQLSRCLINSGERQNATLAMELHDRIGQPLSSLKMNFERLTQNSACLNSGEKREMESFIDSLRDSIVELKQMSAQLLPSIIANLGLEYSLDSLRDETVGRTGLDVHLFTNGLARRRYSPEVEIAVYRVVQEAVNNIIKHAKARHCYINLLDDGKRLSLSVEDDGSGFETASCSLSAQSGFSLGLHIMRERVEQLGGDFSIDAEPGRGTIVLASIPLDSRESPQPQAALTPPMETI